MKLIIVKADNLVVIDGFGLTFDLSGYDLPENLWAIHWDTDRGEFEFTDKPNEPITSFQPYDIAIQRIISAHGRLKHEIENPPPLKELEKYTALLAQRNTWLTGSDWIIKRHRDQKELSKETTLSESEFIEVLQWQDDLRQLPQQYPDSDSWVWPAVPAVLKEAKT